MSNKKNSYLYSINGPEDLRALPASAMPDLAEEIRAFLIDHVEKTGGHLASNLGVVELSIALHRVFHAPEDHIIWDVGHQSYVHKILTGRRDRFDSLRQVGGLSGFTNRRESIYDAFGAGHSSTSVSAALGFAQADAIQKKDAYTVAIIGDGAFTGGMVHEALYNVSPDLPLILILNENEMSISRNTGAFARYIADIRASASYLATKRRTARLLHKIPLIGKPIYHMLRGITRHVKRSIYHSNYFESLGLLYLGPVNGNDYSRVERVLRQAKSRHGAVLVHIKTQKGKGYAPAEADPSGYHSTRGEGSESSTDSFHSVFGEELLSCARENPRIAAITAAMGLGCGIENFRTAFPERYFDVGIAEEHATTFAAGMAADGMIPCFAVYSTFLQRAYDNILHDVALQNLPVKFFIDRAGLALHDGATHHGIFDVAYLSGIPHIRLYAPATYGSLRAIMHHVLALPGPCAIRYPNAAEDPRVPARFYPEGRYDEFGVRPDYPSDTIPDNVILTYGGIISRVLDAADEARTQGKSVGVILLEELKPYDLLAKRIKPFLRSHTHVLFVEEGIENGGAAALTLLSLHRCMGADFPADYHILAISDHFAAPSAPTDLYRFCKIGREDILANLI